MSKIPNNQNTIVGVSIGEALVNSLIRLSILGREANRAAIDTVQFYIDGSTDASEIEMLNRLLDLMNKAEFLNT